LGVVVELGVTDVVLEAPVVVVLDGVTLAGELEHAAANTASSPITTASLDLMRPSSLSLSQIGPGHGLSSPVRRSSCTSRALIVRAECHKPVAGDEPAATL
jgi:hypothetical protein